MTAPFCAAHARKWFYSGRRSTTTGAKNDGGPTSIGGPYRVRGGRDLRAVGGCVAGVPGLRARLVAVRAPARAMRRRHSGGYLDSGRGSVRRSWGILARVSDGVRHSLAGSRVVVPSLAVTLWAVLPVAAVTGSAGATLAAGVGAYPFAHLWHRCCKRTDGRIG